MSFFKSFSKKLFYINNENFDEQALSLFQYQATHNLIYKQYLDYLSINSSKVQSVEKIPFLPIEFFKNYKIKTGSWQEEKIFESSGTTGEVTSKHFVKELKHYQEVCSTNFSFFFAAPDQYHIFALLPSYLERKNASLVYMMQHLIESSQSALSGFYLQDLEKLKFQLNKALNSQRKVILLGVTFALLDFAEAFSFDLSNAIIMDTGGMKGRRKEMIREEVHGFLKQKWNLNSVASEYGMTELMSQAYAEADGKLKTPPWMKVLVRDLNDPFSLSNRKSGGVNIIDLANIHSCAFIETADIGTVDNKNGHFEILGRTDTSDVRGCNLMVI